MVFNVKELPYSRSMIIDTLFRTKSTASLQISLHLQYIDLGYGTHILLMHGSFRSNTAVAIVLFMHERPC